MTVTQLVICTQVEADDLKSIHKHLYLIRNKTWGSLNDYRDMFPRDLSEDAFIYTICRENDWTPVTSDPKCYQYGILYFKNQTKPSVFLHWLKKKIPIKNEIVIEKIEPFSFGECTINRTVVLIGKKRLSFDNEGEKCPDQGFIISKIGNKTVNDLYFNDLNNGKIKKMAEDMDLLPPIPDWQF